MRKGLAATLLVGALWACSPEPPAALQEANMQTTLIAPGRPQQHTTREQDVCAIYRAMFPASVIQPLDSMFGDPRLSTRAEAGDLTPAEVLTMRAQLIWATGGERSHWRQISGNLFVRAFRSWRSGPLPDCDWQGFARAVAPPARMGRIPLVLTADESGSYTRVSQPFFLDRDTAIILLREVIDDGARVRRKLVYTYRDGHGWLMLPTILEDRTAPAQRDLERRKWTKAPALNRAADDMPSPN
jgi:hypothetical protein